MDMIAVGTELLLGQIVDTNSSWMGEQLALAGLDSDAEVNLDAAATAAKEVADAKAAKKTGEPVAARSDDKAYGVLVAEIPLERLWMAVSDEPHHTVALPVRERMVAKNEMAWKGLYALASLAGIVLMVRGYAELRSAPTVLYATPYWMRHVAALLLLPVFIFFIAPYFPGRIKTALKHPQLAAVKLWAFAHLLVNGTLADVLLFGSFLVWAVADRISFFGSATGESFDLVGCWRQPHLSHILNSWCG